MIFITVNNENVVDFMHYMPFDNEHGLGKTKEELEIEGFLIETKPQIPENQEGKQATLCFDRTALSFYYKYVDMPKTPEQLQAERIAQLEADVATANYALMMGGLI